MDILTNTKATTDDNRTKEKQGRDLFEFGCISGEFRRMSLVTQFYYSIVTSCLVSQESNGPSDAYAAISNADRLQAEPESLRKWREEQRERLELLGKHRPEYFYNGTGQLSEMSQLKVDIMRSMPSAGDSNLAGVFFHSV